MPGAIAQAAPLPSATAEDLDRDGLDDAAEVMVCSNAWARTVLEHHDAACDGDDLQLRAQYLRAHVITSASPLERRADGYAAVALLDTHAWMLSRQTPLTEQDLGPSQHEVELFWEKTWGCGRVPFVSVSASAAASYAVVAATQHEVCSDVRMSPDTFYEGHRVDMLEPIGGYAWEVPLDIRFERDQDGDGIPRLRHLRVATVRAEQALAHPSVSYRVQTVTWDTDDEDRDAPAPYLAVAHDSSGVPLPAQSYICQELEQEVLDEDGECSGGSYAPPRRYYVTNFAPTLGPPVTCGVHAIASAVASGKVPADCIG